MNRFMVRVIIGNRTEHAFVEAILGERIKAQDVHVEFRHMRGGAIALTKISLFHQPDQPVALVLNAETSEPGEVEEWHTRLERILSQAAFEGWHVALAVPNLEARTVADPRIKAAFESDEDKAKDHRQRAAWLQELTRHQPFDVEALRRVSPEFRALEDFIDRSVHGPKAVARADVR